MKKLFPGAVIIALLSVASIANAQKIKVVDGDPSVLRDQSSVAFKFTYNNMAIGKFDNGQEYIDKKTSEYNSKQYGKGDRWAKEWVSDREALYEPKFIELFMKYSFMAEKPDSKYTIIFHTSFTEPGYNVYISSHSAEIDGEAMIVETANPDKVLATISIKKAPGRTYGGDDYDSGTRIAESYADAGKYLAKFLMKK